MSSPPPPTLLDRFRGLLLGGAVGDALGAPVEFMKRDAIIARFGPRGITSFAPAYGRLGAVTDDTQMTLFTVEGLIRAQVRGLARGICNPTAVIDHAYRRWKVTQDGRRGAAQELDGWLIGVEGLWSRRAPGNTCMSALAAKQAGGFGKAAQNDSKGAGGIMRVGPIGLYAEDPYRLGCEAAALTHGHVTGIVSSGWFAVWISGIAHGALPSDAATAAWDRCRGQAPELDAMLTLAFELALDGHREMVPDELGEGWIAEEAAAIALWCVLVEPDPMEALRLAVNIDGDSDTTGSLVGQVLGAAFGPDWIPDHLLNALELRDVIEQLAADADESLELVSPDERLVIDGEAAPPDPETQENERQFERFWSRYPGW